MRLKPFSLLGRAPDAKGLVATGEKALGPRRCQSAWVARTMHERRRRLPRKEFPMTSVTVQLAAGRRAPRAPLHLPCLALIAALGSLSGAVTQASEYQPPTGFNGHTWGTPFTAFKGVSLLAANTALGSRGKVVS